MKASATETTPIALAMVAVIATIAAACRAPASAVPTVGTIVPTTTRQLGNGMRVVVHPDPSTPFVTVALLWRVGSWDAPDGKGDFTHLVEHFMLDGGLHLQEPTLSA